MISPSALIALAGLLLSAQVARAGGQRVPEPTMLGPGTISTTANEFGGSMTPDGNEIYFSRSVPRSYRYAIYRSRRVNGMWSQPELAPFSGVGRDFDAVLSPDGSRMLFISDRPVIPGQPKRDYDIWEVDRQPNGEWGTPKNLGYPINRERPPGSHTQDGNEWFASLAADGTLYFASDGDGERMAIYRARIIGGRYEEPQKLPQEVNGDTDSGEPVIAPDQSFLLFASYGRAGGFGDWDIYISCHQPDGSWSAAENLGPAVNTAQRDYSPRLEPDGHTLIFTSERYFHTGHDERVTWKTLTEGLQSILNGQGNIYEIDLAQLSLRSCSPRCRR